MRRTHSQQLSSPTSLSLESQPLITAVLHPPNSIPPQERVTLPPHRSFLLEDSSLALLPLGWVRLIIVLALVLTQLRQVCLDTLMVTTMKMEDLSEMQLVAHPQIRIRLLRGVKCPS